MSPLNYLYTPANPSTKILLRPGCRVLKLATDAPAGGRAHAHGRTDGRVSRRADGQVKTQYDKGSGTNYGIHYTPRFKFLHCSTEWKDL